MQRGLSTFWLGTDWYDCACPRSAEWVIDVRAARLEWQGGCVLGHRWGVTDAEVARAYPCDDLVPGAALQVWRGVSVAVPPERVWPWLCQVQVAPYSYDWIDNLGRRSPRRLLGRPDPLPGQAFSQVGGRFPVGRVLVVEPGQHLTATIMGAVMSYVLAPDGAGTRLLLKIVMRRRRWYTEAMAVGDWPMARRQLLNFKACAEGRT
jgi:hypothetical protein